MELLSGSSVFSFTAPSAAATLNLLEKGPWFFMGNSFTVHPWPLNSRLADLPLHLITFWVQVHGLQRGHTTRKNARWIGDQIGQVVDIDADGVPTGNKGFLRIRIQMNSRSPLSPGFWFPHTEREATWADFRYEKLSDFCFRCGRLGHIVNTCTYAFHPFADKLGP